MMIFENEEQEKEYYRNERRNRFNNPSTTMGKLPPQAVEMEELVLGALLLERDALIRIIDILRPESFYTEAHQKIYSAIVNLFKEQKPIDVATVPAYLRANGELDMIGGSYYIVQLTNRVASAANIEYHSSIIEEKFLQREVIRISTEAINSAYQDTTDVFELIKLMENNLYKLNSDKNGRQVNHIRDIVVSRQEAYKVVPVNGLTGIGTGMLSLDALTSGWQRTNLIIIAARPAMGKTAFALTIARNAAKIHGVPVVIFSLEMDENQLADRMISSEANIRQDVILKRRLTEMDHTLMETSLQPLKDSEIFIDDTPGLTLMQFRSKMIRLKQKHGIGVAVIDYLQLMEGEPGSKDNREQELSKISRGVKKVAKELDIAVIALSQLSREVEKRQNKQPILSDLRESGAIEQDADMVIFLHRPEYYGLKEYDGQSSLGLCLAIVAKNRNGVCEAVKLDFHGGFMRFGDWGPVIAPVGPTQDLIEQGSLEFVVPPPKNVEEDDTDDLPF